MMDPRLPKTDVITESENFYGYLIGLRLEEINDKMETIAYADFTYNSDVKSYRIPDYELYKVLAEYLSSNVFEHFETGYCGISKLWIKKTTKGWHADLP